MKTSRFIPFFLITILFSHPATIATAQTYQETILRDAPVVYYSFESADDGVIRDLSGNGRDGVLSGNAALTESSATKGLGKCLLLLGGRDDGVRVNNAGERKISFAGRKISIEMWMLSTGSGHEALLGAEEWRDGMVIFHSMPDRPLYLGVCGRNPDTARFHFHSVTGLQKSRWNHLVVTYNAMLPKDNVRFYMNGQCVLIATIGMPSPENEEAISLGESFTVGNHWADRWGGPRPFTGMMDEVAVYDKVLTPAQIKAHYLAAGEILEADLDAVGLEAPHEFIGIMPEKSAWSFVFTKPGANWTKQYPLPGGGICVGEMSTNNHWQNNKPSVWMTTKLTLPADYKPGDLFLKLAYDDHITVFINGVPIYQARGGNWNNITRTKRIPDVLVPGDNIIAVYGKDVDGGKSGYAHITLLTDNQPPLDTTPLYPADAKWSYTFDDPGPQWINTFPLPRSKVAAGAFSNINGLWPKDKRNIWMTQVVTLPAAYTPEEMIVQYSCDNNYWLYINGKLVHQAGATQDWLTVRNAANYLKPGKNIIAVRCEDEGFPGFIGVDIFTRKYTEEEKKTRPQRGGRERQPASRDGVAKVRESGEMQIVSDKSAWSFVFVKPSVNWTKQYPLPKGGICVGEINTQNHWPKDRPYVWMTTKVTLPEDFTPGNLYARVRHDDNVLVFVNGTPVYQQIGYSREMVQTKLIPNLLVPGENIIAVYGENTGDEGLANVTLFMDDLPPLDAVLITPTESKWSYTFDDPGREWIGKYPLPRGKIATGPFVDPGGLWPSGKRAVWMTQVVTLPANYVPEELILQYSCDLELWLYVNGIEVSRPGYAPLWRIVREVKNTLRPGKNIIAARVNRGGAAMAGVELFTRKYTEEDKKNPLEGLQRPSPPEGFVVDANDEAELSETEKKIQRAMHCFKLGQDQLALTELQSVTEEDADDVVANSILGMYALTKQDNAAKAYTYLLKCVKANPKDPSVLNNYGVASIETKRFDLALQSWERLAKIDPTLPVLAQNVGCMMDLLNKKRIVLKEPEQLRLVELYILTCANQNRDRNPTLGFLLLPFQEGVAHRPDCDSTFVQEFKRGRETVTCQPYEVKKTYYGK